MILRQKYRQIPNTAKTFGGRPQKRAHLWLTVRKTDTRPQKRAHLWLTVRKTATRPQKGAHLCPGYYSISNNGNLNQFVPLVKVLDAELGISRATVIVLNDRIADVNRIAGLDVVEEICHVECYRGDVVVWVGLLDEL